MQLIHRLGNDAGHTRFLAQHADENGIAHVAGSDNGRVIVSHAQRLQRRLVRRVCLYGLGYIGGDVVYQIFVPVNGQHLMAQLAEIFCQTAAKAADAQNKKLLLFAAHETIPSFQPIMIFSSGYFR